MGGGKSLQFGGTIKWSEMTAKQKLHLVWRQIKSVAINKHSKRFEGVFITDKWLTFDGYYKDNIGRYYKAVNKWKNYKRITNEKSANPRQVLIDFIRKEKSKGYTKKNTCFTSPSDRMKFHISSYKVYLDDKVIGTRDVKNILKKRGVDIKTTLPISNRIKNGLSPFITENRLKKYLWNGKYMPLHEIASIENVKLSHLKNRIKRENPVSAVNSCRSYTPPTHSFEGKQLLPNEICKILSERTGIKESTLLRRFYHWGYDIDKLTIERSSNKHAPYPKIIIAQKGDVILQFNSIREAAKSLGIHSGNLSTYANGKRTGKLKGYTFKIIAYRKS